VISRREAIGHVPPGRLRTDYPKPDWDTCTIFENSADMCRRTEFLPLEWFLYVKEEGHPGRTSRWRSGNSGEDHWKSGWKNRFCGERQRIPPIKEEGHKTREEGENGVAKKGEESGEKSRAAQDLSF
jgi:hypothetical protein